MTFSLFKRLLPNGRAWAIVIEKRLRQFFEGLAAGASDPAVKEFDDRFDDLNPQKTTQLALWENQFNLINTGLTDQERRDRLQGAWSAVGGQSPRYLQDTLQAAGFDVYVHEWWEPGGVQLPGGDSFTNLGQPFSTTPHGVACSADGVIVFVVDIDSDSLYRSTDSGASFTNLGAQFGGIPLGVACSADGVTVYVIDTGDDSLYLSTDSGDSFTDLGAQFSTDPRDVACSGDGGVVYVVDNSNDSIYRSTNSGVSFTDLGAQFSNNPRGVACSDDGGVVYVVDNSNDSIYRSTNSGVSFTDLGAQFSNNPRDVACSGDGGVVYVVDSGDDSLYRSTDSGASFTNLGQPFSTTPHGVACSADGVIVFVVDIDSDSLYRSIGPTTPLVTGSINGDPAPVARIPSEYIVDETTPDIPYIGAGHDLAFCGGVNFFANAQESDNPQGYLLVNGITQHAIPVDPTKYPYFLYIGGATFPELSTVPSSRRGEFEDLCIKICPAQQWLGILVTYD